MPHIGRIIIAAAVVYFLLWVSFKGHEKLDAYLDSENTQEESIDY